MLAHVWCGSVHWGDVPGWLEAVGTVGALGFALVQFNRYLRDQVRQQASKVAVWAESYSYPSDGRSTASAVIYNGSDLPIYECSLRLLPWDWKESKAPAKLDGRLFPCITPGSRTPREDVDNGLTRPTPEAGPSLNPPYEIEFRDSAGHRWVRRPDGLLRQLS